MKNILVSVIILLTFCGIAHAQKVEFTASAPNVVAIDEQFRLSFTVNQEGNNFRPPDVKDFTVLSGPSTSSSSSVQIINGQVSRNISYVYTMILRAQKEGKFNIGSASVQVGGKTYTTSSLSIEVVKSSGSQRQGTRQQQQQQQNQGQQAESGSVGEKDFYVSVDVNRTSVYQGEHILATIKLYTLVGIAGFEDMKFPTYDGFWTQDIETPNNVNLQRTNVNGQIYNVGIIKKVILFPQRSGDLTIDPFELSAVVQKQVQRQSRSMWDNFFGGGYQNVKLKVKSKPVKISVKALPSNKPQDFKGAVGILKFTTTLDKTNVRTNDAITLKVRISGNGNLKLIDPLDIKFPPDFEVYDPKISNDVKTSNDGMEGSKTFEYLVIPRHAGDYTIPPVIFSYFDIGSKQYRSESSPSYSIHVEKGSDEESTTVVSGFSKEDVKFIGKDIRYIKTGKITTNLRNVMFFGSWLFWLCYVVPLLLFVLLFIFYRKQIRDNQNVIQTRNRKANRIAVRRLKSASVFLKSNDKSKFYEEIIKAIMGYLSDKLMIPVAELSKDNVLEKLEKFNPDPQLTGNFLSLISTCEYAQYAPPDETGSMDEIYRKAGEVISEFEQKIR